MKKLLSLLTALLLPMAAFGQAVIVDGQGNIRNPGPINYATGQLKVNGVVVSGGGGGGGGGGTLSSLSMTVPSSLFFTPVTFNVTTSDVTGTMTLQSQSGNTFFGNPTGSSAAPSFMTQGQARTSLLINNVDNTSDINKPVSTAQAAATASALSAFQGTGNIISLGVITSGGWNGSPIGSTYLPNLNSITAPDGDLSLNSHKIINLTNPSGAQDAATKSYADSAATAGLAAFTGSSNIVTLGTIATGTWNGTSIGSSFLPALNGITAPTGTLSLNNQLISNLATPVSSNDAANKTYVDSIAAAGPPHPAVAVASTGNLTLSAEQTIDGVLTSGSRILVKNQSTATQNGIYVTAAGAWSRATDANTGGTVSGNVFVTAGTVNALTQWGVTTAQPITLGSTSIAYTLTGASSSYTAGSGLTLTGSSFSIGTNQVANSQLAQMGANTIKGNNTGSTANAADLTPSQTKVVLSLGNVENTALSTWAGSTNITTLGTITTGSFPAANLSGTVATAKIADSAVTYPKIQNVGASKLLGNASPSTPAAPAEIPIGSGLGFVSGTLTNTAQAGLTSFTTGSATPLFTTSLGSSPTTAPALAFTLSNAPSHSVLSNFLPTLNQPIYNLLTDTQIGVDADAAGWTTGKTAFYESVPLTANRVRPLPVTSNYGEGQIITISDSKTVLPFGPLVVPAGSDSLNGQLAAAWVSAGYYRPYRAGAQDGHTRAAYFQKQGTNWQTIADIASANYVNDTNDPTRRFIFDASLQQSGSAGTLTAARGQSYAFAPTDSTQVGVLINANGPETQSSAGTFTKGQLNKVNILPREDTIGVLTAPPTPFNPSQFTANSTGAIDTIRIAGSISGTLALTFPPAGAYQSGESIDLIDTSGSLSATNKINVISAVSDSFNGSSQILFNEPYGRKVFTSDGQSNWTIAINKTVVSQFQFVSCTGGTCVVNADPNSGKQNFRLLLVNGVNNIVVNGGNDGMDFDFILVQPGSGAAGTIALPQGSKTPSNGLGLVTLTATNTHEDILKGSYAGGAFYWDPIIPDLTSAALPAAPSLLATGTATSTSIPLTWTDNASNENGFEIARSNDGGTTYITLPTLAAVNATSYNDTSLSSSTIYKYKVRAINTGGDSAYSNVATGTTLSGAPTAELVEWHFDEGSLLAVNPTGPTSVGGVMLNLPSWTSSVEFGTGAAFLGVAGMTAATDNGSSVQGTPGATTASYTYRVSGWIAGTHNAQSANIVLVNNPTLDGSHFNRITWNATSPAPDYYEVYRTQATGATVGSLSAKIGRIAGGLSATTFDDMGGDTSGVNTATGISTNVYQVVANSNVTYTTQTTISFWVKSPWTPTALTSLIDSGNGDLAINATTANKMSITMKGTLGTAVATVPTNTTNLNNGSWHNVIVVFDNSTANNTPPTISTTTGASDSIRVYIDGTQTACSFTSVSRTGPQPSTPAKPKIGSLNFVGSIDDVRIYNRIITGPGPSTEMAAIVAGHAQ